MYKNHENKMLQTFIRVSISPIVANPDFFL